MIIRKLALGFLAVVLGLALLALALDIGFVRTATHPAAVKKLVAGSGIYGSVVPSVLAQKKTINTPIGVIATSNPIVRKAARVALPPPYIQENTEAVIDNIYQWLDGQILSPNFTVDLSGARLLFANNIADSIRAQLGKLPACQTIGQSLSFSTLGASCLPPGVSPAVVAEQARASLMKEEGFLDKAVLSADDIKNSGSGQSVFDRLRRAPEVYQWSKRAPAILAVIAVLAGIGIVQLAGARRGLLIIGTVAVAAGVITLIFAWRLDRAITSDITPKIKVSNAVLQTDIRQIAANLLRSLDRDYWVIGSAYTALGAGVLAGASLKARFRST